MASTAAEEDLPVEERGEDDAAEEGDKEDREELDATAKPVSAATFADDLIKELKRRNPPLVPRAENLRIALGLPDDVLMVRTADLVRKAMDELTLALHWHLLYTLVHSAWQAHLYTSLGVGAIRFRSKAISQAGHARTNRRSRRPRAPEVELRVRSDAAGKVRLEGLDEFAKLQSLDLRVLLNHIVRVNTTRHGLWTFRQKRGKGTYYAADVVRSAQLLGNCANFFSHRNAVIPQTVSRAPTDAASDFDAIRMRELQVSTAFFAAVESWTSSLEAKIYNLRRMHAPDRTLEELEADDQNWLHGYCRAILDASATHLRATANIRVLSGKVRAAQDAAPAQPLSVEGLEALLARLEGLEDQDNSNGGATKTDQQHQQDQQQDNEHNHTEKQNHDGEQQSTKDTGPGPPALAFRIMNREGDAPDPREVRFALYTLWTRFGAPAQDEDDEDDTVSVGSAASTRSRSRSVLSAETSNNVAPPVAAATPNESLEFGTIRVTRYQVELGSTGRPRVGVRTSFTVDPLGVTHVDLVHRMMDVTLLALRQALMDAAKRYMTLREQGEVHSPILAHVIESALLVKANGKRLRLDWDTLRATGLQDSQVAMYGEASYDPLGGPLELFCSFARRQDVGDVVADRSWSADDVVAHFFRYEPRFADPRFVAEFLRRLVHPRTGVDLFAEASAMIEIRDRVMHHFHLVHAEHYSISELYGDLSTMRRLVTSVCTALNVDPRTGHMAVVSAAMDDLEDLIGHYKRWRARQHVAFHRFSRATRLRLAQATVRSLLDAYDSDTGCMDRGLRPDLAAEDGSAGALVYLLEMFGPLAAADSDDQDEAGNPYDALVADYDGDDEDGSELVSADDVTQ